MTRSEFGSAARCFRKARICFNNTVRSRTNRQRKKWYHAGCRWLARASVITGKALQPSWKWIALVAVPASNSGWTIMHSSKQTGEPQ